ncbi:MAG TPA: DUF302 domain-containing protein [Nitrospiria bacterium]|nr:DUF302 domain-containing protein [Nitrospiria bacterium]
MATQTLGLAKTTALSYDQAIAKVTDELKKEGFGVLTEIDVKETLKKKLNVDFRPYKILGACNPTLAHQALEKEVELGMFLPCNVIVYRADNGRTVVSAVDPKIALGRLNRPQLEPIAEEVAARLKRVIAAI